jgi:para-aminobenzoate synthetase component 1
LRFTQTYTHTDKNIKQKLLLWANKFRNSCFLDNNNYPATIPGLENPNYIECLVAAGAEQLLETSFDSFENLKQFYEQKKDWLFGFLSYDLKNEIESLTSINHDGIAFQKMHFFVPKFIVELKNENISISFTEHTTPAQADDAFNEIINTTLSLKRKGITSIKPRVTKQQYIENVNHLRAHIKQGDIYEINYCMEFYDDNAIIRPTETYTQLNAVSPSPFSCFFRLDDKYLLSASPERFLHKTGNRIVSQPIKGTIKRGENSTEDETLKIELQQNPKERTENIMIVDLVRNDLSVTAIKGSVKVDELCGIYSFKQVHQMISTVSSQLKPNIHFIDAIKSLFPMGSMTGAPKVKAMQLIEKYEDTKRGLYSGAVGYIKPNGDFDFNVVIRSLQYNGKNKYLSFMVGSAITYNSVAEQEYEECLLKAEAMLAVI